MRRCLFDYFIYAVCAAVYCTLCFGLPTVHNDYFANMNRTITVTIQSGATARAVALDMERAGIVDRADLLVDAMVKLGIDRTLSPGTYELKPGTVSNVALQIKNARPLSLRITLIPGSGFHDAVDRIGSRDAILNALADDRLFPKEVRPYLPEKTVDRMVFLLPETYFLAPGSDIPTQFVKRASALWYERVGDTIPKSLTPADVLKIATIASMTEGEAKAADERPVLAGIFIRRLELGMRLQSCATVIYSWKLKGEKKQKLTYQDLQIDSEYNTYIHNGLPPGPICVPSQESWQSALNPAKTEYLFFFAGNGGRHVFSRTYKEHIQKQKTLSGNGI